MGLDEKFILVRSVLAVFLITGFSGIYLLSRGKDEDIAQELAEYGFKLPVLAAMGALLLEKIPVSFSERKIRAKLIQLFGHQKLSKFIKIHQIQKISLITVLVFLLGLISITRQVDYSFYIFGSVLMVLISVWTDKEIDKKIIRRKTAILVDLPELINTLAILLTAGLPLTAAVQRYALNGRIQRPLYQELRLLIAEINAGRPAHQAYEDLAQRCKVPEITRFVSAVLQNLNRGNADLVHVLRVLSQEAWTKRKDMAKKQGEEASSKLVFPMVIVFLAVAIIVLAPAMLSMGK